jgi:hypothetical protein
MANPTRKLRIDVDLSMGMITKISDPNKQVSIERELGLNPAQLDESKILFNAYFNQINDAPTKMRTGFTGQVIEPSTLTPINVEQRKLIAAAPPKPAKPVVTGTDEAARLATVEAERLAVEVEAAEAEAAEAEANVEPLLDFSQEDVKTDQPTIYTNDILNLGKELYLNKEAPYPPIPDRAPSKVSDLPTLVDDKDFGGARKRRLSRRRPRGSNRKKSLVRNKSKKMRRGKYSRKAK